MRRNFDVVVVGGGAVGVHLAAIVEFGKPNLSGGERRVRDDRGEFTVERRAERTSETIETDMERGERERDGDDESGARVRGDRLDGQDEERE